VSVKQLSELGVYRMTVFVGLEFVSKMKPKNLTLLEYAK
jgi:hypothetical protein